MADKELFANLKNDPAFEYIIERVIIALAPMFEELQDLESQLRTAKTLARLSEEDLKIPDEKIDLAYAQRVADRLVELTNVEDVRALIAAHGAKKLAKLKQKQLLKFVREVQYKLSYIKSMSTPDDY